MAWNPWTEIGRRRLRLLVCDAPVPGLYFPDESGEAVIVIDRRQPRAIRRSAAAEELAHHDLGHRPHPNPVETARMELRAQRVAAVCLVAVEDLATAIVGASSWFEVADTLRVDPELLELRVRDMTDEERARVVRLVGGKEMEV